MYTNQNPEEIPAVHTTQNREEIPAVHTQNPEERISYSDGQGAMHMSIIGDPVTPILRVDDSEMMMGGEGTMEGIPFESGSGSPDISDDTNNRAQIIAEEFTTMVNVGDVTVDNETTVTLIPRTFAAQSLEACALMTRRRSSAPARFYQKIIQPSTIHLQGVASIVTTADQQLPRATSLRMEGDDNQTLAEEVAQEVKRLLASLPEDDRAQSYLSKQGIAARSKQSKASAKRRTHDCPAFHTESVSSSFRSGIVS